MIQELLYNLNLNPNDVLKKKHGKTPEITAYILVKALYEHPNAEYAGVALGLSPSTIRRVIKKYLPELPAKSWQLYFRTLLNKKVCGNCNELKELSEFHKRYNRTNSVCKVCCSEYNQVKKDDIAENQRNYRLKASEQIKQYRSDNKGRIYAHNAKYRANKINAIPPWADLNKIREIYENCPEGYEVDHIHPLQGELICGLHVENNLQYLTISDNRSKSNKFNC